MLRNKWSSVKRWLDQRAQTANRSLTTTIRYVIVRHPSYRLDSNTTLFNIQSALYPNLPLTQLTVNIWITNHRTCFSRSNGSIMYQRSHLTFCLAFTIVVCASNLHINLRRSRDCILTWCVCLFACVCQSLASFTSFWTAVTLCRSTHCQYNNSVHRMEQNAS